MHYLVAYDLCEPSENHANLFSTILNQGNAIRIMRGVFLLESEDSLGYIHEQIARWIGPNDRLAIFPLEGKGCIGNNLSSESNTWLQNHFGCNGK